MILPAYSFACLAETVILLPASTFTISKLYLGSKSHFAYLIIAFTLADGLSRFAKFIINKFPIETVEFPNGYALITNNYFYWLLSLQSWIFGTKYLWSGVLCSKEANWLSLERIKWMGWIGGSCFAILMLTCWCILMTSFPGYKDLAKI